MEGKQTGKQPKDWTSVVDGVHQQLQVSLAEIDERLVKNGIPKKSAGRDPFTEPLKRLAERIDGLDRQTHKAQAFIADIDRALAASEQLLREQLERSESLRQKLAEWVNRAIG